MRRWSLWGTDVDSTIKNVSEVKHHKVILVFCTQMLHISYGHINHYSDCHIIMYYGPFWHYGKGRGPKFLTFRKCSWPHFINMGRRFSMTPTKLHLKQEKRNWKKMEWNFPFCKIWNSYFIAYVIFYCVMFYCFYGNHSMLL